MKTNLLVHKHLIIRAESREPLKFEEHAEIWMRNFVESINMKILMGPYCKYSEVPGNRGLTVAAIIETSHVVMHIWDEPFPALIQLDIYSCGEFDEHDICKRISEDLNLTKEEEKDLINSFVMKKCEDNLAPKEEVASSEINLEKDYYYCSKKIPLSLAYKFLYEASDGDI